MEIINTMPQKCAMKIPHKFHPQNFPNLRPFHQNQRVYQILCEVMFYLLDRFNVLSITRKKQFNEFIGLWPFSKDF